MKWIANYVVAAAIVAGGLNGLNAFFDQGIKLSTFEIIFRAAIWPYTVGQMAAGFYMADVPQPSVETQEEFEGTIEMDSYGDEIEELVV